jgi:hypothetical protein
MDQTKPAERPLWPDWAYIRRTMLVYLAAAIGGPVAFVIGAAIWSTLS